MKRHTEQENQIVEVTPLTKRAFRSTRGLTGGLAFLLMGALATVGLSACGSPAYTYVADSPASTYYKVPSEWHQISQHDLDAALTAAGGSSAGVWSRNCLKLVSGKPLAASCCLASEVTGSMKSRIML